MGGAGGSVFYWKSQEGGGVSRRGRGRGTGRVELGNFFGGGGAKHFFRGRNVHQVVLGDHAVNCSKCYDRRAKIGFRTSKCCSRQGKKRMENSKCYCRLGQTA